MKYLSLIIVLVLSSPLTVFSAGPVIIRWGDVLPAGSASITAMERVSKEVEEKTDRRIRIKVYPSGQLGSSREMIESVMLGFQEMVTEGAANFGQWFSPLSVLEAPYLWRDRSHLEKVMKGAAWDKLKKDFIAQKGLRILGVFYNGFRHITTTGKPVRSLKEMKGFKLRVPENEMFLAMASAWGPGRPP